MNTATKIIPAKALEAMAPDRPTKAKEGTVPPFPLEVFPDMLADYARELHSVNGFLPDYTGSGMLFAASTAIGNAVHLHVKEGYTAPPMLWLVNVGRPSIGKTHPLNTMVRYLAKRDAATKRDHNKAVRAWEEAQEAHKRKGKGKGSDAPPEEPPSPRPVWRPHLVDDVTMEALVAKLDATPRGVGLHCDELAGWLGRMDQYRKGGDRQKWLSIWNGDQITEIRKTAGEHVVPRPFVSVAGGLQPGKLHVLGRDNDGLRDRLLFFYPDEQVKRYPSDASVDAGWAKQWAEVLEQLLGLPMSMEEEELVPTLLHFAPPAAEVYVQWLRHLTDRTNAANASGDEISASLFGKMETYVPRLALLLELLHRACSAGPVTKEVRPQAVEGALKLVDYFEATARKVHFQLFEADEVDRMAPAKAKVYAALPERFATGDGLKLAEALGMKERTFYRMLRDGKLFRKLDHGANLKLKDA
jgi:hypothetical protein